MLLQSTATAVNLVSICDSGQSQLMFTVRKPAITFATTPLRTPDATADVKGTLTGYGEIERVEVDGKAATLTRNPDNSVEFEAPEHSCRAWEKILSQGPLSAPMAPATHSQ